MTHNENAPPFLAQALQAALSQVALARETFGAQFKTTCSTAQRYTPRPNNDWTDGFCTGMYWLAWECTGDDAFAATALSQVDSFAARIKARVVVDHHDMGFLYTPSCVAAWKNVKSEEGRAAALAAADNLLSRFQEKGQFFQAWGALGRPEEYRLIIDCLMNLPLLYWASEETGEGKYREKALAHTRTALQCLMRPDASTYHTYYFDPETGAPVRGVTAQGYRDGSAWARGQAWGIYGTALSMRYTQDPDCIDLFCRVTDYFLDKLPSGGVPYWDLEFQEGSSEPWDSSAGAIAACGMLEMLPFLPPETAARYRAAAISLAQRLFETCAVCDSAVSNGLLLHGVYVKMSPYNNAKADAGVDECNLWGDYFWLELLVRLSRDWTPYW